MTPTSEPALLASHRLLQVLTAVQTAFIQGQPAPRLFDPLLSVLLELTGSEGGFIAEVVRGPEGKPTLQPHTVTNLAWAQSPVLWNLLEAVLISGQRVVSNHLLAANVHGSQPEGQRPLSAFLGLPLHSGGELVGMVGLANRPGGYDDAVTCLLQPCLAPCGSMLAGRRGEQRRRHAEEELRERLVATERLASLGTLTAGMAHEINNPLAYMLSNLNYLNDELHTLVEEGTFLQGERGKELLEALEETLEGSCRVRDIVRDLKLFARKPTEPPGLVDLPALLDSCLNMAWGELEHRARVVKDYGAVPPLYGNESQLAQVFLHLIINAVQALPPRGGESAEIRLSTRHEEGLTMVSIRDTGVGIPEENLERLFAPFFTTKPPNEGTGLGLSICHGIIKELGGHITAESHPGRGSTFRVFLPTNVHGARPAESMEPARRASGE
ncbi:MAG: ATP-binding protein [Hyalangium sp.]|uniref:ATP-binding protein n=1 Tax=Hyalangium sp. TaxID=2028555 RepID=UPI00389A0B20